MKAAFNIILPNTKKVYCTIPIDIPQMSDAQAKIYLRGLQTTLLENLFPTNKRDDQ